VMMRGDDEAENATIRLIQMAEKGELNSNQNRQLMKAVERRMAKVASGTDLHDFLLRLSKLIKPSPQPQTKNSDE
jgi:tape measure domain-containing protein